MIQTDVTVIHKETIAPAWWKLTIAASNLSPRPQPGQFLLVRCADRFSCYLRRPIFPARVEEDRFELLVRPEPDPGLAWLSARQAGDSLNVIGPLGKGFSAVSRPHNLLLVSDGPAIGSLLGQLSQAVAKGVAVTLALGGTRASALYPASALPPIVEYQAATLDGSRGHHGPITDLLPQLLSWADTVCAVGSLPLYRQLKQQAEEIRFGITAGFLFGLVDDYPLACGFGACLSCAIETEAGLKLNCLDGPVFDLTQLNL